MMKRFFTSLLAALAAIWISIPLFAILGIIALGAFASIGSLKDAKPRPSDGTILYIDLATSLSERPAEPDMQSIIYGIEDETTLLQPTLNAIRRAATDDHIKGIYIDAGPLSGGISSVYTLAQAITDFRKESGKWVVAYGDNISQGAYIVASGASELYLNPLGMVDVHGLASNITFYKGLLDKLGIEMQVIKVGTFKSAVEPYILTDLSEANRLQTQTLLDALWGKIAEHIAESRDTDISNVNCWADSMLLAQAPETLVERHIVDSLLYRHQAEDAIRRHLHLSDDTDLPLVSIGDYDSSPLTNISGNKKEIAVLYAEGAITENGTAGITSERYVPIIQDLASDKNTAGMVLRVNSPGGSAFASEQIWEALQQFKEAGKLLYVSMGDYAASGGYYISCGADRIYASPLTITGSIGIYGLIPNAHGLITDKLGITQGTVSTNANGSFPDITRPMTPFEMASMQNEINRGYETFVSRCAEGRDMEVDSIKAIAEGRVWDGMAALNIGLVDELGTLDNAISAIADEAGLEKYKIVEYPAVEPSVWGILLEASRNLDASVKKTVMGEEAFKFYTELNNITSMTGAQAIAPQFNIE